MTSRAFSVGLLFAILTLTACGSAATPTSAPVPTAQPTTQPTAAAAAATATATTAAASPASAPPAAATAGSIPQAAATTTIAPRSSATPAAAFPLEIADSTGKVFKFDRAPKIGCWWAGCTEIMADLGVSPQATSLTPDLFTKPFWFPAGPPAQRVADLNNPEQWAAAGVDLIITRGPASPNTEALKTAAPVFYLHGWSTSNLRGVAEFVENTRIMGKLTGQPERAEAAIQRFDQVVAALKKVAPATMASSTIGVIFTGDTYVAVTPDQPFCDVIAKNGFGKCLAIATPGGTSSLEINAEEFLKLNPTWIAVQGLTGTAGPDSRPDPIWKQLGAVKDGHVYAAGNRYYCCSLRALAHALQEYAAYTFGPQANIPKPGPVADFDPTKSPLLGTR